MKNLYRCSGLKSEEIAPHYAPLSAFSPSRAARSSGRCRECHKLYHSRRITSADGSMESYGALATRKHYGKAARADIRAWLDRCADWLRAQTYTEQAHYDDMVRLIRYIEERLLLPARRLPLEPDVWMKVYGKMAERRERERKAWRMARLARGERVPPE